MIASPSKQNDLEEIRMLADILELTIRAYKRTDNQELEKHIEYFHSEIQRLREKVDHFDYTQDDERWYRTQKSLDSVRNPVIPTSP